MSGCAVRSMSRAWGTLLAPAAMRMNWRIPRACVRGGALEPPGAERSAVGVLALRRTQDSLSFAPLMGLIFSDQTLRSCFLPRSLPRTFSSSNQCRGFVHWRNQDSQGSWPAAMHLGEAQRGEWAAVLNWIFCVTLDKWWTSGSLSRM